MTHVTGPLKAQVDAFGDWEVITDDYAKFIVCTCHADGGYAVGGNEANTEDTANLMAASPDLVAALKGVMVALDQGVLLINPDKKTEANNVIVDNLAALCKVVGN